MYKLYTLIVLIVVIGVAKAQLEPLSTNNYNSTLRTIEYINVNRQQYNKNIQDMDTQLDTFIQNYEAAVKTIGLQQDMLIDSINQMEEEMRIQEHLSDLSKQCIAKYRPLVPTIDNTKTKINSCVTTANYKLSPMVRDANTTRNSLQYYYEKTFHNNVGSCQTNYPNSHKNYTMCVTNVIDTTNAYTITTQKTFAIEMAAAQCSSDANINEALDCSYTTESDAISDMAETNTLINICKMDQGNCKQCSEGYTCSEVHYMPRSDVSNTTTTMNNPFYQRYQATKCMLIKLT